MDVVVLKCMLCVASGHWYFHVEFGELIYFIITGCELVEYKSYLIHATACVITGSCTDHKTMFSLENFL